MLLQSTIRRHAILVDRMAEALGSDLEEAMMRGRVSTPDLDDAVLRCTGCARVGGCEMWLDNHEATAEAPPDYCRNAGFFRQVT